MSFRMPRELKALAFLIAGWVATGPAAAQLPVGDLVHDGPPTPEQLSLLLPVTGDLPQQATATVRFKPAASSNWYAGHPLYRIRPEFSGTKPGFAEPLDAFAWPIIDLSPGTAYDVEVTVSSGGETLVRTARLTTRALHPPAGTPSIIIPAGSTASEAKALVLSAEPGDVIQFENGTYDFDTELLVTLNGTDEEPIYLRGESRDGVVIRMADATRFFRFHRTSSNVIIEDMTIVGDGRDSGIRPASAIEFFGEALGSRRITFRRLTVRGFDRAVYGAYEITETMIHDCTFDGNNAWNQDLYAYSGSGDPGAGDGTPDVEQNLFWNDDGVMLAGQGNVVFNNSFRGFGDTLAFCAHSNASCRGIHMYRNEIVDSGDDAAEVDHAFRNVSLYDNRITNSATFVSTDPLFAGPLLVARNVSINVVRSPFKQNSTISGQFYFNNTLILTNHVQSESTGAAWIQFNNGPLRSWGYRNNVFIYQGEGFPFWMEAPGNDPIDFTHNSWFPDGDFRWNNSGGNGDTLAEIKQRLPASQSVFSGANRRHFEDNIIAEQPFTRPIVLGASHLVRVSETYLPQLADGSPAGYSGAEIPNITDGYSGGSPDRGALIRGRAIPVYGDRFAPGTLIPNAPANLQITSN